jgi:hypothetical protein
MLTPKTPLVANSSHVIRSKTLAHPLNELPLTKVPDVPQAFLRQIDTLNRGHILHGRTADTRGDDNRVRFQNDSIIHNLIDSQGNKVVVLDDGAAVGRVPKRMSAKATFGGAVELGAVLE